MVIDTKSFQDHKQKERKPRGKKKPTPHYISKKPLEMMCKYHAPRESMYQMG